MFVIGITGSFGSGKTTVARFLRQKGARVLDADKFAHQLMDAQGSCFDGVVRCFGKEVLTKGQIDRKKISAVVFSNPDQLKKLSAIIHPKVILHFKREIRRYQKEGRAKAIVLDVPLLFEAKMDHLCDWIIVVKANRHIQTKRLKQRSGLMDQEITRRIKAQMPIDQKIKHAHFVIENGGHLKQTQQQVEAVWKKIQKKK